MICKLCGGACCETMILPKTTSPDINKWLTLHGERSEKYFRINCPCSALKDGSCSIYETRPKLCRDFEVGSPACVEAIKSRRNENFLQLILNYNQNREK